MNTTFARRLSNARAMRCLSQRGLSAATDNRLSPSAIAKYESGKMMPSSSTLILLSKALNVSTDYFFRPFRNAVSLPSFSFRKTSSVGKKQLESIKLIVAGEIEKYLEIESVLNIATSFSLNYSNTTVEDESDAQTMALRFRRDLNIGSDAIVSVIDLLEMAGVKIIGLPQDKHFSGMCTIIDTAPVIIFNSNMTSERIRLTLFHELAHLLLHFADGVNEEKMCNAFANEVLIPLQSFKRLIGETRKDISLVELQAIQKEYGISVDALVYKAAHANIITERRYIGYNKKKNALPHFKAAAEQSLFPAEQTNRYKRLVYRALASELITFSKAASLLEAPIDVVRDTLNLM